MKISTIFFTYFKIQRTITEFIISSRNVRLNFWGKNTSLTFRQTWVIDFKFVKWLKQAIKIYLCPVSLIQRRRRCRNNVKIFMSSGSPRWKRVTRVRRGLLLIWSSSHRKRSQSVERCWTLSTYCSKNFVRWRRRNLRTCIEVDKWSALISRWTWFWSSYNWNLE